MRHYIQNSMLKRKKKKEVRQAGRQVTLKSPSVPEVEGKQSKLELPLEKQGSSRQGRGLSASRTSMKAVPV